jgi:hypothetical protein
MPVAAYWSKESRFMERSTLEVLDVNCLEMWNRRECCGSNRSKCSFGYLCADGADNEKSGAKSAQAEYLSPWDHLPDSRHMPAGISLPTVALRASSQAWGLWVR